MSPLNCRRPCRAPVRPGGRGRLGRCLGECGMMLESVCPPHHHKGAPAEHCISAPRLRDSRVMDVEAARSRYVSASCMSSWVRATGGRASTRARQHTSQAPCLPCSSHLRGPERHHPWSAAAISCSQPLYHGSAHAGLLSRMARLVLPQPHTPSPGVSGRDGLHG